MEYFTTNRKLAKLLNDPVKLIRKYGNLSGHIVLRLDELSDARTLAEIPIRPPQRCHLLKGDWAGCFSVNINKNYRLVFRGYTVDSEPSTIKTEIVTIQILAIIDYH